jgi:hypothetical protein
LQRAQRRGADERVPVLQALDQLRHGRDRHADELRLAAAEHREERAGQLGTISSSRRFKEDIRDMDNATERLMDLRPVLFRFKGREGPDEYGLIAEEVAEVFPDLVVYDSEGKPETVRYHLLSTMLLNELHKEHERVDGLVSELAALTERLAAVEQRE